MNQQIKLHQAVQYITIALAVIISLGIWPLDLIQVKNTSRSDEAILQESDPISVANNGTQMFIAEGSYLKAVDLYVANNMGGETITFRVYDSGYIQLWETFYVVDEKEKFPGFIRIPIEMEMEEGWEYYYTVEGLTSDLILYYEDTYESTSYTNGTFLYGGREMPGINLIARFHYAESFTWWQILLSILILFCLSWATGKLLEKSARGKFTVLNKEIRVQKVVRWTCNPLIAVFTLIALLTVFPGRAFGTGILNYGFYYLGILITAGILLFGINYRRTGNEPLITLAQVKENWPMWAMAVCFAGVLWSCYEYMNGLYNIHHSYATCKLLTWLFLALIFTFTKKEILKIYNLVYLAAACIGGYYYAKPYKGVVELDELYKLQAYVMIVGGFFLLQLIISLVNILRKKNRPLVGLYLPYALCLLVLMSLMVIFRNTRTWPVLLVVIFLLFYLRMWMWEKRDRLLPVFSHGIILHFVYTVAYCLLHRPYLRFRHNRYGMTYHTVTMTGYYLALVLCAIMVHLLVKYRKTRRWQDVWKELSLLGIGNVYLFLTLSRTGYLAAFVMEIFMIIFMACLWEKEKLKMMLKTFALTAAVSILLFPAVFTAQRILPSVYNDPIYSEIEVWEYTTTKTTPSDSELYIDLGALIKVIKNKLLGMEMENLSLTIVLEKLKPIYLQSEGNLLVSTDPMAMEENDYSNGRLDIFREYIGRWNITGHEDMGFVFPDGSMSVHAHNTYLQVIHDHGMITGIVFLVFGIFTFFFSIARYRKEKEEQPYLVLITAITIAFAAAAMVEWIFHVCNPFGFAMMVVITPLLFKRSKTVVVKNGEEHE